MIFEIAIGSSALDDIQVAIDYYDDQAPGLGYKFEKSLHSELMSLAKNPFYQKRYSTVRCFPLKKFPFMIHFSLDEQKNTIYIQAVFHTSRDPKIWNKRK